MGTASAGVGLTQTGYALLLALHAKPRHGYGLIADVEQISGGAVVIGPGSLYRTLRQLCAGGLIEDLPDGADAGPADYLDRRSDRRRMYRITQLGREAAAEETKSLSTLVQAAAGLGVVDSL